MMIYERKIQSKINRMKFLGIFDENDCIVFFHMVICWMLLDVVIGFICLSSGDIDLIGTACYNDTTGRRALLSFPGRRRSGRGHCGRRSGRSGRGCRGNGFRSFLFTVFWVHIIFEFFDLSESLRSRKII